MEAKSRPRESKLSDRALEDGDLRGGITRRFQFVADLILQVGRIAYAVDEEIQKSFGRQQALLLEFFYGVVAHRNIRTADVKDHIVVASIGDPLKP